MAGRGRPKCSICGAWYKYVWDTDTFNKTCACKPNLESVYPNLEDNG